LGKTALNYILMHRYYDEYKKILEKANVTVLPDSGKNDKSGGSTSDILGVVAMMKNSGSNSSHTPNTQNNTSGSFNNTSANQDTSSTSDMTMDSANYDDLSSMIKDTTFYEDPS